MYFDNFDLAKTHKVPQITRFIQNDPVYTALNLVVDILLSRRVIIEATRVFCILIIFCGFSHCIYAKLSL